MLLSTKKALEQEIERTKAMVQRKFDAGVTDPISPMMVFKLKGSDRLCVGVLNDVPDDYASRTVVLSMLAYTATQKAMEERGMDKGTKFPVVSVIFVAEAYLRESENAEKKDGIIFSIITKDEPNEYTVAIPYTMDGTKVVWGEESREVTNLTDILDRKEPGKKLSPAVALITGANMTEEDIQRGVDQGIIPKGLQAAISTISVDMSNNARLSVAKEGNE